MADNSVTISLIVKDGNSSAVVQKIQQQLKSLGSSGAQAGKDMGAGFHGSVSGVQAASAALRELNGDFTNNIRAVERFITTVPGVASALKAAFPVVGAAALAGVLYELGTKVADFVRQVNEVPTKLRDGFAEMNNSARLSNDSLRLVNDNLANEIAKLEHKPQNALAVALDESRIAADKLAISLQNDYAKVTELTKANNIGFMGQLLGKGSTSEVSGNIQNFVNQFRDAGAQIKEAVHSGNKGEEATQRARLAQLQQNAIAYANSEYAKRSSTALNYQKVVGGGLGPPVVVPSTYAGVFGDQTGNLNEIAGFRSLVYSSQDQQALEGQHSASVGKDKQLVAAKDAAKDAAEGADKQAQELVIKANQEGFERLKSLRVMSESDEVDFWAKAAARSKTGSLSYVAAQQEAFKLIAGVNKETQEELLKFDKDSATAISGSAAPDASTSDDSKRFFGADAKSALDSLKFLNELTDAQRQQGFAMKAAGIDIAATQGTLSRYDATLAMNTLHTAEYAEAMARLQAALLAVDQDADHLSPNAQAAQRNELLKQMGDLSGQRAIQEIQDKAALDSNTLSGSFVATMNDFVNQSQDTAAQIKQIFTESLSSINGSLSSSLTAYAHTDRQYWRQVRQGLSGSLRGIGGSILNTGMQKAEGAALGALGFGAKPDGTATNPLYVRIARWLGLGGGSAGGSAISTLNTSGGGFWSGLAKTLGTISGGGGGAGTPAGSDGGGDAHTSTAFGTGFSNPFQGFFASGGDVVANMPAIVGERGPEMFIPRSAGSIMPNSSLGGTHLHFGNIDARGSNDPAATEAAVQRGILAAAPHIAALANGSRTEGNLRRPSSRRI